MNKGDSFLYSVHDYGLPLTHILARATGQETLKGLLPKDLVRYYWTLDSLQFNYVFTLNQKRIERSFLIPVNLWPYQRVNRFPIVDSREAVKHAHFYFSFEIANPVQYENGEFALNLKFEEESYYDFYRLGTDFFTGAQQAQILKFDGHEVPIYARGSEKIDLEIKFIELIPNWVKFL